MTMDARLEKHIDHLIDRYPKLIVCREDIVKAYELLETAYSSGRKLLVSGNGGSASDSEHIVGELMKSFVLKREINPLLRDSLARQYPEDADYYLKNLQGALPAISLVNEVSLITAFGNDQSAELAFAQQVLGYGKKGDVLLAISTSGNSANVIHAARIAHAMEISVVSMTGESGGRLRELSDVLLNVPLDSTNHIQELHLPLYHAICLALEQELFGETGG